MKHLLSTFLLSIIYLNMNAQAYPFSAKWQEVDQQLSNGKLKSVEPLVDEIYQEAQKENDAANRIKALIVKSTIAIQTSDDEDIALETERDFLNDIQQQEGLEKAVLQSLLGQLYFNYLRENHYRIANRSVLASDGGGDFRTWDGQRFFNETNTLLQASLAPKNLLAQAPVEKISPLLEGETKWRYLRPTIYDLLAHRALDIYQQTLLIVPTVNKETLEKQIKTIYGTLTALHRADPEKSALVDARLNELMFDYRDRRHEEPYHDALLALHKSYETEAWSAEILYQIAAYFNENLNEEDNYVKAVEVCDKAIREHPNSLGADKCRYLKGTISKPSLQFETDNTWFAHRHNPLYIRHKNADTLFYRAYRLDLNDLPTLINGFRWDYANNKLEMKGQAFRSGKFQLRHFSDYKTHSTKLAFPPLPPGNYILVIANNSRFRGDYDHSISQTPLISTALDVNMRHYEINQQFGTEVQVLDKATGLPKPGSSIQVLMSDRSGPYKPFATVSPDSFGRFRIDKSGQGYYQKYLLEFTGEPTYFPVQINAYTIADEPSPQRQMQFFTDRKIYRPGQTIYFKGIVFQAAKENPKISPHQEITVSLHDTNDEELSRLKLVSNEFGSVHGEFVLPASGISGQYHLRGDWGQSSHYLQVEEYKRPKFQVKIDSLNGIYHLDLPIQVSGNAQLFSGAAVSGARVRYRVNRTSYNPYYRSWWRPPFLDTPAEEIARGESTTNKQGQFGFAFLARSAKSKAPGQNRAYQYNIEVEVVDISGETHTVVAGVNIGDIPLQLVLEVEENAETATFKSLNIRPQNLNGLRTQARGQLQITEIVPAGRVLRSQQQEVEYELEPRQNWLDKLPYIAYENDHLPSNRKRGKVLVRKKWDTVNGNLVQWEETVPPGYYEVKATSVAGNDTVETLHFVTVSTGKAQDASTAFFTARADKKQWQPGEKIEITFSSAAQNANVIVELEADGKIIKKEILKLSPTETFSFPVEESHRGGVFVHSYFNKFNETNGRTLFIDVPFSNKKLDITTSTFRNKLEPGQEETWDLCIKDKTGDRLLAEVLAGMYDKSLDEFMANPWAFFPYPNNR
ncbi:MAG: MG2 domain-containing protein, partial [Draconibacterium sp.]